MSREKLQWRFVIGIALASAVLAVPVDSFVAGQEAPARRHRQDENRRPGQQQAARRHRLDGSLELGTGGYNRRQQPRRSAMQRPLYTVSATGEMRYNYNNAFRGGQRYGNRAASVHYDHARRMPQQGVRTRRSYRY